MSPVASVEPAPLTGVRLMLAGIGLALANFIVVLDISIANVSVPHIAGGLGISPSQGTWVITSYGVADAISVPLTGWLSRRFGAVKAFIGGLIGFGLFSMLCGFAWSLGSLVVFRVGQGMLGGPLMPLTQTLMLRVFPRDKATTAMTVWSMTTVCAPIAGPILGGWVTDNLSWPWIFFINLPVVGLCIASAITFVRPFETMVEKRRIDLVGLALLVLWVGSFQITLDFGRERDWFGSPLVVATAILAVIGLAAFIIWELTDSDPVVDLRVFRHRGFAVGASTLAVGYATLFSIIVLVPLWLQSVVGYTASQAGWVMAFTGLLGVAASPLVARLSGRLDLRALICFGLLWLSLTAFIRAEWTADAGMGTYIFPLLLQGIGIPFFFIGLSSLSLAAVTPAETASAAGLMSFMRTAAGAMGASIAQTYWDHAQRGSRNALAGSLNATDATLGAFARLGLAPDQALRALEGMVDVQASTVAVDQVFITGGIVFILTAAAVWLAPRPRRLMAGGGGH